MESNKPVSWELASEMFGEGNRHYFMDVKRARNNSRYLRISRSDRVENDKYQRSQLVIFENDLGFFVEALTMVLGKWSHDELENNQQLNLWQN